MQGYPPGYDPSMDPTLSGMGGGYQVGMDPTAGAQLAPAPGMGQLGMPPQGALAGQQNIALSGGDQFALGVAQTGEMATNAFFLSAMASPILTASGHAGLARYGRFAGAVDPFRMLGAGHKVASGGWAAVRGLSSLAGRGAARIGGGTAARMGAGMALRAGGMAGRMAIAGSAAATGYGIPLALAMGAMEVPIQAMSAMAGGIQDRSTGMATLAGAAPASMNYSGADARAFGQHTMPGMAKSMGMDMGGMQELVGALGSQGSFNGAQDMSQFSSKLRTALNQLKQVAQQTDSTLSEANQMITALNAHGFQGGGTQTAAMSVVSRGQVSGLGQDAIYASGTVGSDVGRQLGLNRQMMFNEFSRGASTMAFGANTGRIDSNLVNFFGGAQQAATMTQAGALQGFMGSNLMAYAMDPTAAGKGQSVVDQDRLQQVLQGRVNAEMMRSVTPEMRNASLQERARHVLAPHAQQAVTAFGLAGGAGDRTAAGRMVEGGFAASPEQALLMLQQRRASAFESTAVETQQSLTAGQSAHRRMLEEAPGIFRRGWRGSGIGEVAHDTAQWARSGGPWVSAQFSNWGTPDDVSGSVGAIGLRQAQMMTDKQIGIAQGMQEEMWSTGMNARSATMAGPGSGNWFEGTSGPMSWKQLKGRSGWGTGDMFEQGEEMLEDRHNQIMNNPTLARELHKVDPWGWGASKADAYLTDSSREGDDFLRTEDWWGGDHVIKRSVIDAMDTGLRQGAAFGASSTDARQLLAQQAFVYGGEGGSARSRWEERGRSAGILTGGGATQQERVALTMRETVLRGGGTEGFGDQLTERQFMGLSPERRVAEMGRIQGALAINAGAGFNAQDMIGATGNVGVIANMAAGEQTLSNLGRRLETGLSGMDVGGAASRMEFRKGFISDEATREAFSNMLRASSGDSAREMATAMGIDPSDTTAMATIRTAQMDEVQGIAASMEGTAGGEIFRQLAEGFTEKNRGTSQLEQIQSSYQGHGLAERVDAAAAYSAYHKASDPALRRLTGRIKDYEGRTTRVVEGGDAGFEGLSQERRDVIRRLTRGEGLDSTGFEDVSFEDRTLSELAAYREEFGAAGAAYERATNAGDATWMTQSMPGAGRYGGFRPQEGSGLDILGMEGVNDRGTYVFQTQQEASAYWKNAGISPSDRWSADIGNQAEGSVGQEFYRAIGGLGDLGPGSLPQERLAASRELVSSLYDYQGDQTQEMADYAQAVGQGRAQRTTQMMGTLLAVHARSTEDQLGDARTLLRQSGMSTAGAEERIRELSAASGDEDRGRQVELAMDSLGRQLDQTLVSGAELQQNASETMQSAGTELGRAAAGLQSAARALGGTVPGESTLP